MANESKVVDWGDEAEGTDEFIVHPDGHQGMFIVTKDAELIKDGSEVRAVKFFGSVDGANVNEYLPRYQDRESGKMGFNIWKIGTVLKAFGLRKHGDPIRTKDLLKIKVGKKGPCKLMLDQYGKCKACGRSDSHKVSGPCSCGAQMETRESNKVDEWLDPAKGITKQATAATSQPPVEQVTEEVETEVDFG